MIFTCDGLVIAETAVGENDKLLTLLTAEYGRIRVSGKGVRSIKSKMMAATQLFCYGNYEIYKKGDFFWLREAYLREAFFGLREDITTLALATYICDLASETSGPDVAADDILRLTLNTLYAIAKKDKPLFLIKAVYELRSAAYSGFMPDLSYCADCKKTDGDFYYLDVMNGCILCGECAKKRGKLVGVPASEEELYTARIMCPLDADALVAMRYALFAKPERMLSFSLSGESGEYFARAAETYILNHLERGFDSLDFYKSIS